jgi:Protein of unknown function (DUF3307)
MNISPQILELLMLLAGLQFKHFICDGPLQTKAMVDAKSVYGAKLGLVHSGLHGIGTYMVFALVSPLAGVLAIADFVIHYHIDFAKENIVKAQGWAFKDAQFWWALSADQMLHQFTYLALVGYALKT